MHRKKTSVFNYNGVTTQDSPSQSKEKYRKFNKIYKTFSDTEQQTANL